MNFYQAIKRLVPLVLLVGISTAGWAQCGLMYEVPLVTKVQESGLVVEGKVISQTPFWNANQTKIYTRNVIEVYKVFKGTLPPLSADAVKNAPRTVTIITEGGRIGNEWHKVHPNVDFNEGHIGVMLLKASRYPVSHTGNPLQRKSDEYEVVASKQGFLKYDIYHNTASDVFHHYTDINVDVYQTIENLVGQPYQNVKNFNIHTLGNPIGASRSTPVISSFSPDTVAAGGAFDTLTINGTDFDTQGPNSNVAFLDADDATYAYFDTKHIVSWSNTQIKIIVPEDAGTAQIRVRDNALDESALSTNTLVVRYAVTMLDDGSLRKVRMIDDNGSGQYEWKFSTNTASNGVDFYADDSAVARMMDAMTHIRCAGGYQFDSLGTTSINTDGNDGTNVIMYDNDATTLPAGVLGTGYSQFSGCGGDTWYVSGVDIRMKRDGTDGVDWYFLSNPAGITGSESDFESVSLHELLHTCQLGHVNRVGSVMHRFITNGTTSRVMSAWEDEAALSYMLDCSDGFSGCSQTGMTAFDCMVEPTAGFTATPTSGCVTPLDVNFTNTSTNNDSSHWDFGDGNTSIATNPMHSYTTEGSYTVELIVTNDFGADTSTMNNLIVVGNSSLPDTTDFESGFPPAGFTIDNADGNTTWVTDNEIGSGGSSSNMAMMDHYNYGVNIGTTDDLITPEIGLCNTCPKLIFDVAYARFSNANSERLLVLISTDGGTTWPDTVYNKSGKDADGNTLPTVGNQTAAWAPTMASHWRQDTADLCEFADSSIKIMFRAINGFGNNMYLDNIIVYSIDTITWDGSVSTSWTNPDNWTPACVPHANSHVIIPGTATAPTQPILSTAGQECKTIDIKSSDGALLEITGSGTLEVESD